MYGQFTDRARKVMQLASQEAQRFQHEFIGTEHILLGLVKEGSGVAATVLKGRGVPLNKIRLEIEKLVQSGVDPTKGKLPLTQRGKNVIEYAIEEAQNPAKPLVGTEHLLLGLVREKEGVAGHVLIGLGMELEQLRLDILKLSETDGDNGIDRAGN